eukprot:7382976-Prymnesium_polylepis.1
MELNTELGLERHLVCVRYVFDEQLSRATRQVATDAVVRPTQLLDRLHVGVIVVCARDANRIAGLCTVCSRDFDKCDCRLGNQSDVLHER